MLMASSTMFLDRSKPMSRTGLVERPNLEVQAADLKRKAVVVDQNLVGQQTQVMIVLCLQLITLMSSFWVQKTSGWLNFMLHGVDTVKLLSLNTSRLLQH